MMPVKRKIFKIFARNAERSSMRRQLLKNNILLEQIFENAADGMCIIDNDYQIIRVNSRLTSLLGVKEEELLGKRCSELIGLSFCDTRECPMEIIKTGIPYYTYEAMYNFNKRTIPFLITATPLLNPKNNIEGMILSYKDITELLKYRQKLREAKDKAEKENMLKTKFLANMSHEIRTPMNGIIGVVELMGETELDELQEEYLHMLKFSGDRLMAIINDILDVSKIESGKLEYTESEFNFIELIDDTANYFKLLANKKGLDFRYKLCDQIPDILVGDPDRFSQVLFNLLGNAVKFTNRGYLSLDIDLYSCEGENVCIKLTVEDTGIGIPLEKIEEIFESFNQLDSSTTRKYSGTGLGLTISKELIKLMGGEIDVRSKLGEGSIFTVKLKFLKGHTNNFKTKTSYKDISPMTKDKLTSLNILVAEDDSINQKIIKTILQRNNWTVTMASNGKETLGHMEHQDFDLVLLDIYMPEMDGFQVARKIREREALRGEHTPIIALTAAATSEDKEKCSREGMDGYISKPIKADKIYESIVDVLEEQIANGKKDINISEILDRLDGDKNILQEIIFEVISDDYERDHLGKMKLYIEKRDYDELRKLIHKFKGSISNFGAENIVGSLRHMKEAIKTQDQFTIEKLSEEIDMEFKGLVDKLKKLN